MCYELLAGVREHDYRDIPIQTYFDLASHPTDGFSKLYFKFNYTGGPFTFHIYFYSEDTSQLLAEEIYPSHFHDTLWSGQVVLDPNHFVDPVQYPTISIHYTFNTHPTLMSLKHWSFRVMGEALKNLDHIHQLPIPRCIKTQFQDTFFQVSHHSLKTWFDNSPLVWKGPHFKRFLYYYGLPGLYKSLDILKCLYPHSPNACILRPAYYKRKTKTLIFRYKIVSAFERENDQNLRHLDRVRNFRTTQVIFISDYPPNIYFKGRSTEFLWDHLYVVQKNSEE